MLELTKAKGVSQDRLVLFPNWVDTTAIKPLPAPSPLREEFGIAPEQRVALYSGNIGEKQGLEMIIAAARMVRQRTDLLFVICGDGAARLRIERSAEGLTNVRFFPLQPLERLNELLNLADIHLLPQKQDVECFVMPSKLLGMMASGRPIVASARQGSDLSDIVSECGLVVPPGDSDGFADAVLKLMDDQELTQRLGQHARQLSIEKWDVSEILTSLERSLLKLQKADTAKLSADKYA
jgi:colanic acid biosynthesis glycosyl transferase WcaI